MGGQQLDLVKNFEKSKSCIMQHLLWLHLEASQVVPESNPEVATYALKSLCALLASPSPDYKIVPVHSGNWFRPSSFVRETQMMSWWLKCTSNQWKLWWDWRKENIRTSWNYSACKDMTNLSTMKLMSVTVELVMNILRLPLGFQIVSDRLFVQVYKLLNGLCEICTVSYS